MSRREKLLDKWRKDLPTDAPVTEVEGVIDYFFPGGRVKGRRGSHMVIRDTRLENKGGFGPLGRLEIPVVGGQRVKGVYLRKLMIAIDLVLEMEALNSENEQKH